MSGISFMGSYSGIDRSTVDQLMEIERLPLKQFATKKTSINEQQNAWKDINTRLNSLFEKIKTMQSSDTFTSKTSTSTNEDIVSISASINATNGTYKVSVSQLATSSSIIGGKINFPLADEGKAGDSTTALGIVGKFGIVNGDGVTVDIDIKAEDSLKDIVNSINLKTNNYKENPIDETQKTGSGITASIIDGRLVLTDGKTGDRNIQLIGDGKGTLVELGLNSAARRVEQGQDSIFTINGVEVTRSTNSISDVVEGLTINLKKVHEEGQYDNITIGLDNNKAEEAIKAFVDQYNSTIQFIEDKLAAGDPDIPGSKGTLAGDSSLMRLHASLRNLVTSKVNGNESGFNDISQLGVSTIDKFGKLQFNASKFKEALADDPSKVMEFFFSKNDAGDEVGFVSKVNNYIDSFISTKNGIIKGKNETYDRALKDIARQIDTFEARMVKKEEQLVKQFTALDVAMMQAESQMTWLQGQVDAMNGIKR